MTTRPSATMATARLGGLSAAKNSSTRFSSFGTSAAIFAARSGSGDTGGGGGRVVTRVRLSAGLEA